MQRVVGIAGDGAAAGVGVDRRGPARDGRGPRRPAVGISAGCQALRHCYMTGYCCIFSIRAPSAALAGDAGRGDHAGRGPAGRLRRGGEREFRYAAYRMPGSARRRGHSSASVVHRVRIRRHPARDEADASRDPRHRRSRSGVARGPRTVGHPRPPIRRSSAGRRSRSCASPPGGPTSPMVAHVGSPQAHPCCLRTLTALKAALPGLVTVYGGVYPTYHVRDILAQHPEVDVIVRGEGRRRRSGSPGDRRGGESAGGPGRSADEVTASVGLDQDFCRPANIHWNARLPGCWMFRSIKALVTRNPAAAERGHQPGPCASRAPPSRHPQRLHRRRHRVGEEHRIDPLHDVARRLRGSSACSPAGPAPAVPRCPCRPGAARPATAPT